MPTENPDYDPRWAKVHDYHAAERDRCMAKQRLLQERFHTYMTNGHRDSYEEWNALHKEIDDLEQQIQEHSEKVHFCLGVARYPTIQDIACLYFDRGNFDSQTRSHALFPKDYEQFKTKEQIFDAYSKMNELKKYLDVKRFGRFVSGRPEGQDIFEPGDTNSLSFAFYDFDTKELFPLNKSHTQVCVLIDKRDDFYHICFFEKSPPQLQKDGGMSVTNSIEYLATAMYRRISQNDTEWCEKNSSSARTFLSGLAKKLFGGNFIIPTADPSKMRFYCSRMGLGGTGPVYFSRVDMQFRQGSFFDPQFFGYDQVPVAIEQMIEKNYFSTLSLQKDDISIPAFPGQEKFPERRRVIYEGLARQWNSSEGAYVRALGGIIEDYIALESLPFLNENQQRRHYSFMREIVSEFENYALCTAAAYIYSYGTSKAAPEFKDWLSKNQRKDGVNDYNSCESVVREYFSKMKCGLPRIRKISLLFEKIGYPVEEFNNLERFNQSSSNVGLVGQLTYDDYTRYVYWLEKDPSSVVSYIKNIDELIYKRNAIEHDGAVFRGKFQDASRSNEKENASRPNTKENVSRPYAKEGYYVDVTVEDMVRYLNATLLFMNHMKRALDYHLGTRDLNESKVERWPATPVLLNDLRQLSDDFYEHGNWFDPVLLSSINFSHTIDENIMFKISTANPHSPDYSPGEAFALLREWLKGCAFNFDKPYTPYIPMLMREQLSANNLGSP